MNRRMSFASNRTRKSEAAFILHGQVPTGLAHT